MRFLYILQKMRKDTHKYIIGVDEVGRGPLAGPVAVGVVKLEVEKFSCPRLRPRREPADSESADSKLKVEWARGFRDSKKLSAKAREAWMVKIEEARSEGWLEYAVAFVAPSVIDKRGIVCAIQTAIARALETVETKTRKRVTLFPIPKKGNPFSGTRVLLDGGLRAPAYYKYQETIIKGDEKELAIALASIVAKVTRDKRMVALAKKFPHYGFEQHKGYGTHAHYVAIKKHGVTPHHRRSFLKSIFPASKVRPSNQLVRVLDGDY